MSKSLFSVIVLILVFILVGSGCSLPPISQDSTSLFSSAMTGDDDTVKELGIIWSQQSVGLWVTGEGKAYGIPDVAILTLGVEVQEKSVTEAQRGAVEAMDRVVEALKGKGVADKDIQTQQFNIQIVKQWFDKENREEVLGYRVTNMVIAKIRKVNDTGSVIDAVAAVAGDATRIDGVTFSVDDPTPYYKDARDQAVAYAIAKAKQIAGAAGIKLGKPIYITENVAYMPVRNYLKGAEAIVSDSAPTSISSGELEFQVSVQMVYTIE